jgi:competence protein ComEA
MPGGMPARLGVNSGWFPAGEEPMRDWLVANAIPLGLAVAVGGLVALFAVTRPAPAAIEVRPRDPQPTPTVVAYVHVEGAVLAPGVYSLPGGARIFEAIDAAGGATEDADARQLNRAARIADGQKLVVPFRAGSSAAPSGGAEAAPQARPTAAPGAGSAASARINVNTASQRVLETLPGVGPVSANRIIEYRQAHGPFTQVEQLRDARLGDTRLVTASTFERIRNLISVDSP